MTRTAVVFPAPFGPSRAHTDPPPTCRSTSSSTTFSPYLLMSPATEIALATDYLRTLYVIGRDDNVRRTEIFRQRPTRDAGE
jgi:hypothetical protein